MKARRGASARPPRIRRLPNPQHGGKLRVLATSVLVALILMIDRLPLAQLPKRGRGRLRTDSDRLFDGRESVAVEGDLAPGQGAARQSGKGPTAAAGSPRPAGRTPRLWPGADREGCC